MNAVSYEKDITADGFSDKVYLNGHFNFSLTGTWTAEVWVQRSFDGGGNWEDVEAFTDNTAKYGFEPEFGTCYRFGCKTGGYTSGTIHGRLGQ